MKKLNLVLMLLVSLAVAWTLFRNRDVSPNSNGTTSVQPVTNHEGKATKEPVHQVFVRPSPGERISQARRSSANDTASLDMVTVPDASGIRMVTIPRVAFEAKQREELLLWENTRLSDAQAGINREMRNREDSLLKGSASLRLGMTATEVVQLLGEPVKINVAYQRQDKPGGVVRTGAYIITRAQQETINAESCYHYTPHARGQLFNKPTESFQVLTIGFDKDHKVFTWHWATPHPTVYVEYATTIQ